MNINKQSEWIYVNELAQYLEVSRKTIYKWICDNRIPQPIRLGRMRWKREIINDWLHQELEGNNCA